MIHRNRIVRINKVYIQLSDYLFDTAPIHRVSEDAPQTFAELKRRSGSDIIVWRGASDRTIYQHREVNWAFRAIHDMAHLELDAGFDEASENRVAKKCIDDARRAGLESDACAALYFDSTGQNWYYNRFGAFISDQAGFVTRCMEGWLCTH